MDKKLLIPIVIVGGLGAYYLMNINDHNTSHQVEQFNREKLDHTPVKNRIKQGLLNVHFGTALHATTTHIPKHRYHLNIKSHDPLFDESRNLRHLPMLTPTIFGIPLPVPPLPMRLPPFLPRIKLPFKFPKIHIPKLKIPNLFW